MLVGPQLQAIDDVARSLNVSARTAHRRLGQYGYSFRQLLDRARQDQAEELLAMPSLSVDAVASAVGFTDSSNFRRAYKRWTGRVPRGNRPPSPATFPCRNAEPAKGG